MRKLILLIISVLAVVDLFAYPITPKSLRKLVVESEYIIVGEVIRTKNYDREDRIAGFMRQAIIQVTEVLKGQINTDKIHVSYGSLSVCPTPARYQDSTYILAFLDKLDKYKEKEEFYTHALSYGSKTLTLEEIDVYKRRIKEIQDILKIKDKEKQRIALVEWFVKCAENKVTRWEGIYELSPESSAVSYYDQDEKINFKKLLKIDQKSRLKNALLSTDDFSYTDIGIIDLIVPEHKKEALKWMIAQLKKNMNEKKYFEAGLLMEQICLLEEKQKLREIYDQYNFIGISKKKQYYIKRFLNQL